MKRLSYLATFAVFALLLVPTAWAQTQDQEGQDQDQGQDQSQGQGVVAVPVPEARSIDIRDNRFEPADATVAPGTSPRWISYDQAQHTVTADDGQFDSGTLDPGDIFVVTVEGSGKLTYHCELHRRWRAASRSAREATAARPPPKRPPPKRRIPP